MWYRVISSDLQTFRKNSLYSSSGWKSKLSTQTNNSNYNSDPPFIWTRSKYFRLQWNMIDTDATVRSDMIHAFFTPEKRKVNFQLSRITSSELFHLRINHQTINLSDIWRNPLGGRLVHCKASRNIKQKMQNVHIHPGCVWIRIRDHKVRVVQRNTCFIFRIIRIITGPPKEYFYFLS
jgi:hypothetical protein